jgi:hypothetical protein
MSPRTDRCRFVAVFRQLALVSLIGVSAGCSGGPAAPSGPSAQSGPVSVLITAATGGRWASSGVYFYEVSYTAENASSDPIEVAVSSHAIFGPQGEALVAKADSPSPFWYSVGPQSKQRLQFSFSDGNLANPWAERIVLRISSRRGQGGDTRTLSAETPVTHGPAIPRVLEFSASPSEIRAGDPLTVRWNVVGATRIRLSRWIINPTATTGPTVVDVEPAGSRTIQLQSADRRAITLFVDDWAPEIIDVYPIRP